MANSGKIAGRFLSIRVRNPDNAWIPITTDFKSVSIEHSGDDQESTTFGDNTHTNLSGLMNYSISVDGFWAGSGADNSACVIQACLIGASTNGMIQINPAGSTAGSMAYVACVNFSQVSMSFPVENIATFSFTCTPRAGSLSGCPLGSIWDS